MYRKEKSRIAHGWSVLRPDGSFLCWQSDAAVANDIVSELNLWRDKANATPLQSQHQGVAGKIKPLSSMGEGDSGGSKGILRQRF